MRVVSYTLTVLMAIGEAMYHRLRPCRVPDADDSAGALIALISLGVRDTYVFGPGIHWLLQLQNSDGGWPTFCRGWANLPFDRSGADLTAHALRAIAAWIDFPWSD